MEMEDYAYLDELEDRRLNQLADAALKEPGEIPFEEIKKKYETQKQSYHSLLGCGMFVF